MDREIGILGTQLAERGTFYAHDAKASECHFVERCKGMVSDTPPSKSDSKYHHSDLGCYAMHLPSELGKTSYTITQSCQEAPEAAQQGGFQGNNVTWLMQGII